jgi:queuine tRNA-ribosyltransferase
MFEIVARSGQARIGRLHTPHGVVETPVFAPVATKGVIKTLTPDEAWAVGTRMVIVNALHLFRRSTASIQQSGGIHTFMGWKGVVISDSGGFQSIKHFPSEVSPEGITFAMPDGTRETFTPERSLAVQENFGVDFAYALDDCPAYPAHKERVTRAVDTTIAWAIRSQGERRFAIMQGGTSPEERMRCAQAIAPLDFDGFAIGGLCIGEPLEDMHRMVATTLPSLPEEKPRHLMGVGSPDDVVRAIEAGIDIFDSAFPTRNARHGAFFTDGGHVNLGRAKVDMQDIPSDCSCPTCQNFSLRYLNHLFREKDPLGPRLASMHNLYYINQVIERAKERIR